MMGRGLLYILDDDDNPVDVSEQPSRWSDWLACNIERRRVDYTDMLIGMVSTVFFGCNTWPMDPPLVFETMFFPRDRTKDVRCERTATRAAAQAAHDQMVAWARNEEESW